MEIAYYLIVDANGLGVGAGVTSDGTIPHGRVICTSEQAQSPYDWAVENGQIVPSPNVLANAQAAQMPILSGACKNQIIAGFASASLGAAHTYASDAVDQRNILLAAQSVNGGLLSCADLTGTWSRKPHTQAQAQQVAADFIAVSDTARVKLAGLEAQVNAATTVAAVQAVMWGT